MIGERRFLGDSAPLLEASADALLDGCESEIDLSRTMVVLPTSRAGRLLCALLLERLKERRGDGAGLWPPVCMRPDAAADRLLGLDGRPAAGPVAAAAAWEQAVSSLAPARCATLGFRTTMDRAQWVRGAASRLAQLSGELARAGSRLGEIASRADLFAFDEDRARWLVAAEAQRLYQDLLPLPDAELRRLDREAVDLGGRVERIVLIGCLELSPVVARALAETPTPVEPWVHARRSDEAAFDLLGRPEPEVWRERRPEIDDDAIEFALDPSDQATRALTGAAVLGAGRYTDEVVLVTPDSDVLSRIERRASVVTGVRVRSVAGRRARDGALGSLLDAVTRVIESCSIDDVLRLCAHPAIEPLVTETAGPDWLALAQSYAADHPTGRLDLRVPGFPTSGDERRAGCALNSAAAWVASLLDPIDPPEGSGVAAEDVGRWLSGVVELVAGNESEPRSSDAGVFLSAAAELIGLGLRPVDTASALRLVLSEVGDVPCPPPDDASALELVGWLEAATDPSPVLLVAGLRDGLVPQAPAPDPMLPEPLRRAIGLPDADDRLAVEACRVQQTLAGRDTVRIIAGTRGADGVPVWPSRLLLGTPGGAQVRRVSRLSAGPERAEHVLPSRIDRAGEDDAFDLWHRPAFDPPESMRVTSFRDYLASPRLFFLRHVLRTQETPPPSAELTPLSFGTIVHEAIRQYAQGDGRGSDDPATIREALLDALAGEWRRRIPGPPRPAVGLQRSIAEIRLSAWAEHESARRREGWDILHAEWSPDRAELVVDGTPMGLRGRLDRIERHRETGEIAVIDFKTGDKSAPPDETHRKGDAWIDLQLPLYAHLVSQNAGALGGGDEPASVAVGYGVLGRDGASIGHAFALWDAFAHAEAMVTAERVVRSVREGLFDDVGDAGTSPGEGPMGDMCALPVAGDETGDRTVGGP
ncbi:MAG: PD-(D/E)XK nuclease family protein [Planctomycetota bacterium]